MEWQTVRGAGYIYTGIVPRQRNLQAAGTFLQEIIAVFARSSARFYDAVSYLPFIYRERQLQAELLPAIHQVADLVLVEFPVNRQVEEALRLGRMDYLVRYQDKFIFFIELKFDWVAAHGTGLRQGLSGAWQTARTQLDSVPSEDLRAVADELGVNANQRLIKLALLVTPCYRFSASFDKLTTFDWSVAPAVNQRLVENLDPAPNLSFVWMLHQRLQAVHQFATDHNEIYPCVAFMARAETL